MSRNLGISSCCGVEVKLSDLRGKPIEFRRYGAYAPHLGAKWTCPKCETDYFAFWNRRGRYWRKPEDAFEDNLVFKNSNGTVKVKNYEKGRFVFNSYGRLDDTGYFYIDLSYYDSFDDEKGKGDDPQHLCLDDAENVQQILTG